MFLDVELEYVIWLLHPNDIAHFLYWYYSLGEFVRFVIQYYLYNQDSIEKETAEYLSKASEPELKWFNENYADELPLVIVAIFGFGLFRLLTNGVFAFTRKTHLSQERKPCFATSSANPSTG